MSKWIYPTARRQECNEIIHNIQIADPYRWLENPDSDETKAFVSSQGVLTRDFIKRSSIKDKFEQKMTQLMDYEK
jgi:prolyl oligopeptidase